MRRPFTTVEALANHLRSPEHGLTSEFVIEEACERCRIGCDKFWCGFCEAIVSQHDSTTDGQEFRIKHIGDHFDKDGLHIENWICIEQNKAKKYITIDQSRSISACVRNRGVCIDDDGVERDLPEWEHGMFGNVAHSQSTYGGSLDDQDAENVSDDEMMK